MPRPLLLTGGSVVGVRTGPGVLRAGTDRSRADLESTRQRPAADRAA